MFLNTTSMAGDISEPLRRLLDYIDGRLESSATDDPYIHQVHQAVEKAKTNAVWRREYMQWQAEMRHEKRIVAEEARAEGMILGTIETLRDDGKSEEEILSRITDKYDLTEEEAEGYLNSGREWMTVEIMTSLL